MKKPNVINIQLSWDNLWLNFGDELYEVLERIIEDKFHPYFYAAKQEISYYKPDEDYKDGPAFPMLPLFNELLEQMEQEGIKEAGEDAKRWAKFLRAQAERFDKVFN